MLTVQTTQLIYLQRRYGEPQKSGMNSHKSHMLLSGSKAYSFVPLNNSTEHINISGKLFSLVQMLFTYVVFTVYDEFINLEISWLILLEMLIEVELLCVSVARVREFIRLCCTISPIIKKEVTSNGLL